MEISPCKDGKLVNKKTIFADIQNDREVCRQPMEKKGYQESSTVMKM